MSCILKSRPSALSEKWQIAQVFSLSVHDVLQTYLMHTVMSHLFWIVTKPNHVSLYIRRAIYMITPSKTFSCPLFAKYLQTYNEKLNGRNEYPVVELKSRIRFSALSMFHSVDVHLDFEGSAVTADQRMIDVLWTSTLCYKFRRFH